ncbi:MAG: hypothetical protein V4662_13595 [Verrucomicrobiota bacterium]
MSDEASRPPRGKIGRLSARTREQVNRWLHDNEPASVILPKLNAMPEVQAMLAQHFNADPINADNLSAWRRGEHLKWLKEQERITETRERCRYSAELAKASGGNLSEGALAQLTGEVMELVEELSGARRAGQEINPKVLTAAAKVLVAARAKELDTKTHELNVKRSDQKDRELDLAQDKFEMQFTEAFLKFYDDQKAKDIAASGDRKEVKMDKLRALMFGARPQEVKP